MDICNRADLGVRCHINTGTSWQENAIVDNLTGILDVDVWVGSFGVFCINR
jgi:hypothetical protein